MLLTLVHQSFASLPSGGGGELPNDRPLKRAISPPPPLSSKAPGLVSSASKKVPVPNDDKIWIIAGTTEEDVNEPGFPKSRPLPASLNDRDYVRSITYYVQVPAKLTSSPDVLPRFDINVTFEGANWIIRVDTEKQPVSNILRARLVLSETAQESLNVAIEMQVIVNDNPYNSGKPETRIAATKAFLITDNFSLRTNPSSTPVKFSYLHELYPKEHAQTPKYTYLAFRMFRVYGAKSSSSLPRVGSLPLPSAPGPSQREVFGRIGMYNRKSSSCFMNVIFEVLASLRAVSREISGITKPGNLIKTLQLILKTLSTKDDPCTFEAYFNIKRQSDAHQFYIDIRREGEKNTDGTQEALGWNNLVTGTSVTLISELSGNPHSARMNEFEDIGIPIGFEAFEMRNALEDLYCHQHDVEDYLVDGVSQ